MEFGLYLPCYYPDSTALTQAELFRQTVEQAHIAEELGFTSVTIPEHHFIDIFLIPSPLLQAVKVAEHTQSIPIVTAVLPLPFYNLLRVAGEITLADYLTEGRLELGLGRGALAYEFIRFEAQLENNRPAFQEACQMLEKLLIEEDVTFHGEHYELAQPTTIMPRPAQLPRPPIWIGALSEDSIRWSVEQGYNVQTTPLRSPWEVTRKMSQWFVQARDAQPEGAPPVKHHMLRQVYVSKRKRDVEAMAERLLHKHRKAVNTLEDSGAIKGGVVEPVEVELTAEEAAYNVIFGDPEEVIERLHAHEELGIDAIQLDLSFGAPHEQVVAALELFAEEVMPSFAGEPAGRR